ncbi:MAG: hypothetical protein WAP52_04295 [Candidatus Sungiibacteriota bacterium]
MNQESRTCQNCKNPFTIEPEDFAFYEKMKVPPPTFCPECRLQRRLMFRNERSLYKRKCDLCGKEIITMHSPNKKRRVYCCPCWWSDKWDASEYAMDYDPSRSFFEQFRELQERVPFMALITEYPTLINSDYVNHAGNAKNSFFVFNGDYTENCCYLTQTNNAKECMDGYSIFFSELSYESINIDKSYGIYFSEDISSSHNIYFSKNLIGCNDCFGCVNLRNKQHYIFNEPYSAEEYKKKIQEFSVGSSVSVAELREKARIFWQKSPHKSLHGAHNVNSSGDYIYDSKNVKESYLVNGGEDMKFCQWINMGPVKDAYDYTEWGAGGEQLYECLTVGQGASNVRMSHAIWMGPTMDIEYCMYALASNHMFGCIGMRKKEYCILNKQYSKEEYLALRARIIADMNARPYTDARGRKFPYGEFFPYDLSLFDYNESSAQDYFPLTKEQTLERGWRWKDKENTVYQITKQAADIPDHIKDAPDAITKEIIACAVCGRAYRIIQPELELLRRFGFPLPRNCFECRYQARLSRMNPMCFYDRVCAKCGIAIRTAYAPERPEIVYCEQCYQAEVL